MSYGKIFLTLLTAAVMVTFGIAGCGDDDTSTGTSQKTPTTPATPAEPEKTFTDDRDGKKYKMAKLPDGKTWMAQNLNYETLSGSWCYDDDTSKCGKYGRLYNWTTAMDIDSSCIGNDIGCGVSGVNHQGICPDGWHLPTRDEWDDLIKAVGTSSGTKLKAKKDWIAYAGTPTGTDKYGFSALPGGFRVGKKSLIIYDGTYVEIGESGIWWTSIEFKNGNEYIVHVYDISNRSETLGRFANYKDFGYSLRCVQNDATAN